VLPGIPEHLELLEYQDKLEHLERLGLQVQLEIQDIPDYQEILA
jgi:hypothetical protein